MRPQKLDVFFTVIWALGARLVTYSGCFWKWVFFPLFSCKRVLHVRTPGSKVFPSLGPGHHPGLLGSWCCSWCSWTWCVISSPSRSKCCSSGRAPCRWYPLAPRVQQRRHPIGYSRPQRQRQRRVSINPSKSVQSGDALRHYRWAWLDGGSSTRSSKRLRAFTVTFSTVSGAFPITA